MAPPRLLLASLAAFAAGWGVNALFSRVPAPPVVHEVLAQAGRSAASKEPSNERIVTPLNLRDPSALVMTPSPGVCPQAKPCDCSAITPSEDIIEKQRRADPRRF